MSTGEPSGARRGDSEEAVPTRMPGSIVLAPGKAILCGEYAVLAGVFHQSHKLVGR